MLSIHEVQVHNRVLFRFKVPGSEAVVSAPGVFLTAVSHDDEEESTTLLQVNFDSSDKMEEFCARLFDGLAHAGVSVQPLTGHIDIRKYEALLSDVSECKEDGAEAYYEKHNRGPCKPSNNAA